MHVYSKPDCQPCRATYRALDAAGVEYTSADVSQDSAALEAVQSLGYQSVPVVVVDEATHWFGFRPDLISQLKL